VPALFSRSAPAPDRCRVSSIFRRKDLPPWQLGSSLPGVGLRLGALFSTTATPPDGLVAFSSIGDDAPRSATSAEGLGRVKTGGASGVMKRLWVTAPCRAYSIERQSSAQQPMLALLRSDGPIRLRSERSLANACTEASGSIVITCGVMTSIARTAAPPCELGARISDSRRAALT